MTVTTTAAVAAGAGGDPGGRPPTFGDAYRIAAAVQADALSVRCPQRRCAAPVGVRCSTLLARGYHVGRFEAALRLQFGDLGGHADGEDDPPLRRGRRGRPRKRVA